MSAQFKPKNGPDSFDALLDIVERLRAPNGCPWDRQQTHASLKRNLVEECYEVLEAIDQADSTKLAGELGDLLVQVAFHCQIAKEADGFQPSDVLRKVKDKLVRRHPHVFGNTKVTDIRDVEQRWDKLKQQENGARSPVEGIPQGLPALAYAQLMWDRASREGLFCGNLDGVLDKLAEEIMGLRLAETKEERAREMGDALFSLVNLASWLGIHAEDSLRQANVRFKSRYAYMEELSRNRGLDLTSLPEEEREKLWQEARDRE